MENTIYGQLRRFIAHLFTDSPRGRPFHTRSMLVHGWIPDATRNPFYSHLGLDGSPEAGDKLPLHVRSPSLVPSPVVESPRVASCRHRWQLDKVVGVEVKVQQEAPWDGKALGAWVRARNESERWSACMSFGEGLLLRVERIVNGNCDWGEGDDDIHRSGKDIDNDMIGKWLGIWPWLVVGNDDARRLRIHPAVKDIHWMGGVCWLDLEPAMLREPLYQYSKLQRQDGAESSQRCLIERQLKTAQGRVVFQEVQSLYLSSDNSQGSLIWPQEPIHMNGLKTLKQQWTWEEAQKATEEPCHPYSIYYRIIHTNGAMMRRLAHCFQDEWYLDNRFCPAANTAWVAEDDQRSSRLRPELLPGWYLLLVMMETRAMAMKSFTNTKQSMVSVSLQYWFPSRSCSSTKRYAQDEKQTDEQISLVVCLKRQSEKEAWVSIRCMQSHKMVALGVYLSE